VRGHLYFHTQCFDGVLSAALLLEWLRAAKGWKHCSLHPVGYEVRATLWPGKLEQPAAVVDFLFHPDAEFWFDHHETAFSVFRAPASLSQTQIFDSSAKSAAGLIWRHLFRTHHHREDRFRPAIAWANKIDSAGYESVDEAFSTDSPAMTIRAALMGASDRMCGRLVELLSTASLQDCARDAEVAARAAAVSRRTDELSRLVASSAHLTDDGIVMVEVAKCWLARSSAAALPLCFASLED